MRNTGGHILPGSTICPPHRGPHRTSRNLCTEPALMQLLKTVDRSRVTMTPTIHGGTSEPFAIRGAPPSFFRSCAEEGLLGFTFPTLPWDHDEKSNEEQKLVFWLEALAGTSSTTATRLCSLRSLTSQHRTRLGSSRVSCPKQL